MPEIVQWKANYIIRNNVLKERPPNFHPVQNTTLRFTLFGAQPCKTIPQQ